ncbi:hypothetical protein Spica_2542 [Gracilinema caldarium DSM 7334]|uniref:Helicase XPB/Ssl2 N-terminal domain-containing protein n=1 Tax=Gracilinema caldarium (strain ATCC 51460 / DSM 7334 / H1) TaxID=744872 RepID=F8F4J8_GRAC1|nr:hypothetical protein [Gracilinema caldarium]AEJ20645.1 hypothetical protein Spica_2542 [Gracilinema caldarium DSM 7334]
MNSVRTPAISIFPSIENWKAALMQLPEGPFFDILRSYLGDIKTPFNKQRLVDDLTAFLSRQEIQKRIAALLDDTDRRCILAIAMLFSATLQDLAIFFEGDYSYAELYGFILNLEERLLVFKTMDEGRSRISLNPVLEPILVPILQEPSILFPALPIEDLPSESSEPVNIMSGLAASSVTSELILGALLAWLFNAGQVFKSDGSFKKKAQDELEHLFAQAGGASFAGDLTHALEYLGILRVEEGIYHIDEYRLEAFASLEPSDRCEYLAAALLAVELDLERTSRRLSRDRLQNWTRLIHRILHSMQDGWIYNEQSLRRFWLIEAQRAAELHRFGEHENISFSALAHCPGVDPIDFFHALIKAMKRAGLLVPVADGYIRTSQGGLDHNRTRPFIVCDASFSIVVYPEIPFKELSRLARFCRLLEAGQTLKLELSRDGFIRALDRGFRLDDLKNLLETLSTKPIPQSLVWSLDEWEHRYHAAALYKGMILVLESERRYIVEIDSVKDLIDRELAPGVYLLRDADESLLSEVLEKAGLDTLARPAPSRTGPSRQATSPSDETSALHVGSGTPQANHAFSNPQASPAFARMNPFARSSGRSRFEEEDPRSSLFARTIAPAPASRTDTASLADPASEADMTAFAKKLLEDLHSKLEAKPLTKEQKNELSARIDRRLILDESQLVAAAVRYEKLEARGLDYVGKVRLVEQALSQRALIELFWRGPKGEANRAIIRPLALEKSGTELMLRSEYYPEGEVFNLSIGKISLVRRLKRSIFGE